MELRKYQKNAVGETFSYCVPKHKAGEVPSCVIAIPTGGGKSLIIAEFCRKMHRFGYSILVLSHVKEILQQNYKTIYDHTKIAPTFYSAGLGQRVVSSMTIAGIQSVYKKPFLFDNVDVVIIDECHLISPNGETMYRKFLSGLNPKFVLGLSATPYRLKHGLIYGKEKDLLFDACVYDLTSLEAFNGLIQDGFLCNLVSMQTNSKLDMKGIHTGSNGDFKEGEMDEKFNTDDLVSACCDEIISRGQDRKKWLVFAVSIDHAENIAETMIKKGIPSAVIHSKMNMNRNKIIADYKEGKYRCLVNVNILTTGFDSPNIDLIAMLRPTKSPVLHVQSIGRGLRPHPGKENCLVLDFAGNTRRLGPINDIHVKRVDGTGDGTAPTKVCPDCQMICHAAMRVCENCGHKFKIQQGKDLDDKPDENIELIREAKARWHNVKDVTYTLSSRSSRKDIMEIKYYCDGDVIKETICLEHSGFAGTVARNKLKFRGMENPPETIEKAIDQSGEIMVPVKIYVDKSERYPKILNFIY